MLQKRVRPASRNRSEQSGDAYRRPPAETVPCAGIGENEEADELIRGPSGDDEGETRPTFIRVPARAPSAAKGVAQAKTKLKAMLDNETIKTQIASLPAVGSVSESN